MLTLHSIAGPIDSREAFTRFDPREQTWIVSDLKSKLDLNRKLLASRSFIAGESVLRASELWKVLLSRARPDLQIVSKEFIQTLTSHKLSRGPQEWARTPGAAAAVYDYMSQLMPVLSHPDGEEMLREWFKENPASRARWGRWFDLSLELWRGFLEEGFVAPSWASGVLTNEPSLHEVWERSLIVDLGADLDQVEADLLVQLADHLDVTVLVPEPEWRGEYRKALVAYEVFEKKMKVNKTAAARRAPARPRRHRKYTTMIAEVKDAVAQARIWLEAGVARAEQIALVAPDMEIYWPALASYLDEEGIACQKDIVRRLHSFPDIARWLAALRLRVSSHDESDLELALFEASTESSRLLSYERFKILYSALYGREDLHREEVVARRFALDLGSGDEPSRDDFVAWSLKQLPSQFESSRVEALFRKVFAECPQSLRLPLSNWLAFIEQVASRAEVRVQDGAPGGINCLSLGSSESSPATHMIIFGLTESALKTQGGSTILFSDIASLAAQFGFHLSSDDQGSSEFAARWLLEDPERELILSVPETDFAGSSQAPSWLWIQGARAGGEDTGEVFVPRPTRWDELQQATFEQIAALRAWSAPQTAHFRSGLSEDLGEAAPQAFAAGHVGALSPSLIEDYLDCPFVFAAKRLFALSDVAELDLEVDAIRRGNLMHKVFELLTVEPRKFEYGDGELVEIVEKAREASELQLADERLWPTLRARHLDLARRFLSFEQDDRRRFPAARTLGREVKINGYIDVDSGEVLREPGADRPALRFTGRIDRIDSDADGNLTIYDYKSSPASAAQYGSWLKKNQIQLLLYALAVEQGLAECGPRPVLAALYYVARPLNKDFGFKTEDVAQGLYDVSDKRKKNRISPESRERFFQQGQALIATAIKGIQGGSFRPSPRENQLCDNCKWGSLCRSPHLN